MAFHPLNSTLTESTRLAAWNGVGCALLLVIASGCSSGRYTTMYLNQLVHERAEQEVKLETMALDLETAQSEIMTLQMENQKLREQAGLDPDAKPLRNRRIRQEPEKTPAIDEEPKVEKIKKNTPADDLHASAPDLEIGPVDESESPPAVGAKNASLQRADETDAPPDAGESFLPAKSAPEKVSPPADSPSEGELPDPKKPESAATGSSSITSVAIDKNQTRGEDLDGQPGDEGVLVVIQPRDAAGKYAPQTAAVTIEVIDSPTATKADPAAQVAQWKFSAEEVKRATRNSALGKGAYLSVDWDEHRPAHEKLLIIATWKSPTGEELTSEHVVRVNLKKSVHAWDSRLDRNLESGEPAASVATRPSNSSKESKSWAPSRR